MLPTTVLLGRAEKVHSNLTNVLAPNTVILFLADGNWTLQSMLNISRPTADTEAASKCLMLRSVL